MSRMVIAMHSSTKTHRRTMTMAIALVPLAAGALSAQHTSPRAQARARTQVCVNGKCVDDTTRVVVVRLMDRLDSLQRLYLGTPISPEERDRMADEMSAMVSRIADIQRGTMTLSIKRAAEAQREAMADAQQQMGQQYSMTMDIPSDVAPKGWIGATFAGWPVTDVRDGEFYVRYQTYPEVVSVDADSPAEHAGIARGDLLLAFNGKDVTEDAIPMTRLLQPDRKLIIRLERDGRPRDFQVVVGKAPRTFVMRMNDMAPAPPDAAPPAVLAPESPRRVRVPGVAVFERAPDAPSPAPRVAFFGYDSDRAPILGAMMNTMNAGLGQAFGVDKGVLVLDLSPGTPADAAGLQAGDVIVKAAGTPVTSVSQLRRTLERHGADATVELQIVRDKKTRTIKLPND